jgi:lysozyme
MISNAALEIIKAFEGKQLRGYLDPVAIPTIGYGITEAVGLEIRYADGHRSKRIILGKAITEREADRLKMAALDQFEAKIAPLVAGIKLNANEWGAIISLSYNIGPAAFARSSVLRRLRQGDRTGAANAFQMWNKAGGKVLNGLVRRRRAERALFLGNVDEALSIAGVSSAAVGALMGELGERCAWRRRHAR